MIETNKKSLKLFSIKQYSIEWYPIPILKHDEPIEQADILLSIIYNCLPGSVFDAFAERIGITSNELDRICSKYVK